MGGGKKLQLPILRERKSYSSVIADSSKCWKTFNTILSILSEVFLEEGKKSQKWSFPSILPYYELDKEIFGGC